MGAGRTRRRPRLNSRWRLIVFDADVPSLIVKGRLPAMLAARLLATQAGITFVTLGELAKWSVMREWGGRRRDVLDVWVAGRPVLADTEDVARWWGEFAAYASKHARPRPVNDTWIAAGCLTCALPLARMNVRDVEDVAHDDGFVLVTA